MTREDINKYAYAETVLPAGAPCPDRCLWFSLRDIYRQYRSGEISKEEGEKRKNRALRQHEHDSGCLTSAERILKNNARMWMEIELSGSAYALDRTLENADRFINAVYGVKHSIMEVYDGRSAEETDRLCDENN